MQHFAFVFMQKENVSDGDVWLYNSLIEPIFGIFKYRSTNKCAVTLKAFIWLQFSN